MIKMEEMMNMVRVLVFSHRHRKLNEVERLQQILVCSHRQIKEGERVP